MKKNFSLALMAILLIGGFYFGCKKDVSTSATSSEELATKKPGGGGGGGGGTLDPLTLTCQAASGASINVTVCAGASGASAGFSIQWETLADYNLYGWSAANAPSYRCASLSGVPGCKGSNKYSLGPNGCVIVNIGDNLFDDCGASAECGPTGLECETAYIFRAFAHNVPGGANASDKSGTTQCTTFPCGGEGCTYTQGFWKTHGPVGCVTGNNTNNWPADVLANGLTLGGVLYTADQLCTILNTPAGGTNLALAHQLITALINIANGSSGAPQSCIDDANAWLAAHGINGKQLNSDLTQCLTDYNEGATGPGHCSSN